MAESKQKTKSTEIERLEKQFDAHEQNIKNLTQDRMNESKKEEIDSQTKLSTKEIEKNKDIYLKPERAIGAPQKFNEDYREQYNFAKEYVHFTAENREIIGEAIEMWTRPFGGIPAEFWKVPVNKPVWGPRYLAEQIKKCSYHRLRMDESKMHSSDNQTHFYGQMVVDTTVQRLDAIPVSPRKSIFMGVA